LRTGQVERGQYFASHALPNSEGFARLAVVVSRKVSRRAVDRNRLKRRIRECFRLNRNPATGIDLVVVARKSSHRVASDQLDQQLLEQWKKLASP